MHPLIEDKLSSLDDLFDGYLFVTAVRHSRGGNYYPHEPGWYFLSGLPGSIDIARNRALFVKPKDWVRELVQPRLTNGAIGSFRAVQSATWRGQGKLPVFVTDTHHIASPLLAFVRQEEHERFNKGDRHA